MPPTSVMQGFFIYNVQDGDIDNLQIIIEMLCGTPAHAQVMISIMLLYSQKVQNEENVEVDELK